MPTELHPGLAVKTRPHNVTRTLVDISMPSQKYLFAAAIQGNANRAMGKRANGTPYVINFGLPVQVQAWGGTTLTWNVKVTRGNTFRWVTGSTPANVSRQDHEVQASAPFRMCRVHWSVNKEELADCRGAEEITDLRMTRRLGAEQDFAASFEQWGWGAPPPATDLETAYPLRYSLFTEPEATGSPYSAFTSLIRNGNGNFLNLNHASYTGGPFGISRADYQQWGNWNCQFTTFADATYTETYTAGCHAIGFETPVPYPNTVGPPMQAAYTTLSNRMKQSFAARGQNDSNTSDLQSRFSDSDYFGIPHYAVPAFDDGTFTLYGATPGASKDVVYLIDWASWAWITKEGFNMEDMVFTGQLSAPLDETYLKYLKGNLICWEPRRNAVLSK